MADIENENDFFDEMEDVEQPDDTSYLDEKVTSEMESWYENGRWSPEKFRFNTFTGATGKDCAGILRYRGIMQPENSMEPGLYLCTASIRNSPYIIEKIELEEDARSISTTEEHSKSESLIIYGHREDKDNEFDSRLDLEVIRRLSISEKFKYVSLYGAFKSISDLSDVIEYAYEHLIINDPYSSLRIYLDSKVPDDNGEAKTLANMINSGYIDHTLNPNYRVEYVYTRFDRRLTAPLFTKELSIDNNKPQLFD